MKINYKSKEVNVHLALSPIAGGNALVVRLTEDVFDEEGNKLTDNTLRTFVTSAMKHDDVDDKFIEDLKDLVQEYIDKRK